MTPSVPSADAYASEPVQHPPLTVVDIAHKAAAVTTPHREQVLLER